MNTEKIISSISSQLRINTWKAALRIKPKGTFFEPHKIALFFMHKKYNQ